MRPDAPYFILSVGGGQDSTALLYRLGLDASFRRRYAGDAHIIAIMAATGDEHGDTDAHVPTLNSFASAHGIEFVHLTFDLGFHSGPWARGLGSFYERARAIGSSAYPKSCTENLKVAPIYRYLARRIATDVFGDASLATRKQSLYLYEAAYGALRVAIGIAAGEEGRIARQRACKGCTGTGVVDGATCAACGGSGAAKPRHKWMEDCVERVYPLIDERMDRAACQAYIASVGMAVPPPSNCFMCPFKSPVEVLWTSIVDPARFAYWVALERAKLEANAHMTAVVNPKSGKVENKNYGVFKDRTLLDVLADAKRAYAHWTFAELTRYRMSHGHCVASSY